MSETEWTAIYIAVMAAMLLCTCGVSYAIAAAPERDFPDPSDGFDVAASRSPGLCCVEYFSPVQRRVIIEWVAREPCAAASLRSFAKQLQHCEPNHPVPIYWGQVRPLLDFLHDHELSSISRRINRRLMQ